MAIAPIEERLYSAIGSALHRWSSVELRLANLFSTLMDSKDYVKARSAFDSVISFEVRLNLCDNLMRYEQLNDVDEEIWRLMVDRLSRFYKKRHQLAHFSFVSHGTNPPKVSPFATGSKLISGELKELTEQQIRERGDKFGEISGALFWLWIQARRRRQDEQAAAQHVPEPPFVVQLRELAIRNLEDKKLRSLERREE